MGGGAEEKGLIINKQHGKCWSEDQVENELKFTWFVYNKVGFCFL
jgi:hypothetical protein